ncbi:hypothetical protein L5515_019256 [Caenorhabditis briggsae]|uniref:Uncharacterized protein n=1 Tax=Caenorhabditis briggsae TaxID=6238 RepID=A0AAE9FIV9_CAEBR|nr:hypothetical protein L5515_019256 [Caenorhabditis briggsae]
MTPLSLAPPLSAPTLFAPPIFEETLIFIATISIKVAIKEEVIDENEGNILPVTTKASSYVYNENNGPVPQSVKEASATHFFHRGHLSKREKITPVIQHSEDARQRRTMSPKSLIEEAVGPAALAKRVRRRLMLINQKDPMNEHHHVRSKWARVTRQIHNHRIHQYHADKEKEKRNVPELTLAETVENFLGTSRTVMQKYQKFNDEVVAVGVEYGESVKMLHFDIFILSIPRSNYFELVISGKQSPYSEKEFLLSNPALWIVQMEVKK